MGPQITPQRRPVTPEQLVQVIEDIDADHEIAKSPRQHGSHALGAGLQEGPVG